ncbi:MAG: CrcB family protein [Rhodoglobus sp.]
MTIGRQLAAVMIGGLIGTSLRLGIDALLPHRDDAFPLSTLIINTLGAFVLGALVSRLWPVAPVWLRVGLGPGLMGSFTTFSAVAVGLVGLSVANQWMTALAYLGLTLVLGFGAAGLGLALAKPAPHVPEYEE